MLRTDCIALDRLQAFDSLGYYTLHFLYDSGVEPTVKAITNDGGDERTNAPA